MRGPGSESYLPRTLLPATSWSPTRKHVHTHQSPPRWVAPLRVVRSPVTFLVTTLRWPPVRFAAGLVFLWRAEARKVATWCPQVVFCQQAQAWTHGRLCAGAKGTGDCSPQSSYPRFSLGAGVTCRTLRGTGSVGTRLGCRLASLGNSSSSACPVGSEALRIRTELTRPGSTSRTRVCYCWQPHHVPQASNNVVAAAVTLLYSGSVRPQHSGLQTRCPFVALCVPVPTDGAQSKIEERMPSICVPPRAAGRKKGPVVHPTARSQPVSCQTRRMSCKCSVAVPKTSLYCLDGFRVVTQP